MLKPTELRNMSVQELQELHISLCREIFSIRSGWKNGRKLQNPNQMKAKKKDRARVLTVLHEKSCGMKG